MSFQCPAQQQAETSHRQRQMDLKLPMLQLQSQPWHGPFPALEGVFIWSDGVIKFLKDMFVFLKRGCQNYISWFHPTATTKPASTTAHEAGIDEGIWSQPLYIRAEVRPESGTCSLPDLATAPILPTQDRLMRIFWATHLIFEYQTSSLHSYPILTASCLSFPSWHMWITIVPFSKE